MQVAAILPIVFLEFELGNTSTKYQIDQPIQSTFVLLILIRVELLCLGPKGRLQVEEKTLSIPSKCFHMPLKIAQIGGLIKLDNASRDLCVRYVK